MMSGSGILTNGKGTRREYGQYNLDALAVIVNFRLSVHYVMSHFLSSFIQDYLQWLEGRVGRSHDG